MTEQAPIRRDFVHTILSLLFICLLIVSTLWILRPFLVSIAWATVIVVATWPLLMMIQKRLANKRAIAVLVMTTALLLVILTPLTFAVVTIAKSAENISARLNSFDPVLMGSPPQWLKSVPLAGKRIAARWTAFTALSPEERSVKVAPHVEKLMQWFMARAGSTGRTIVNFLLTVIIATILFVKGETVREGLLFLARRLAGRRGEEVAFLAAKAIRGVMLGVLVTALIQAAVGGIGLLVAGVPGAGLLTAVMVILCLAQLGPLLVMVPSVVWLYWSGQPTWGTVLLIFSVVAGTIDNFLRPILIKKGADLPLLLILGGVIGGLIAFGIIGIFIGPVVLAIAHTLLKAWVSDGMHIDRASPSVK